MIPIQLVSIYEGCAFCRRLTGFSYVENDVPVCGECAVDAQPEDVPNRATYKRRELIAIRSDALDAVTTRTIQQAESRYKVQ